MSEKEDIYDITLKNAAVAIEAARKHKANPALTLLICLEQDFAVAHMERSQSLTDAIRDYNAVRHPYLRMPDGTVVKIKDTDLVGEGSEEESEEVPPEEDEFHDMRYV